MGAFEEDLRSDRLTAGREVLHQLTLEMSTLEKFFFFSPALSAVLVFVPSSSRFTPAIAKP